jgi:hypothetical protein
MDIMNVFRQDAFSTLALTSYVERNPYVPTGLGQLNIFDPAPIDTTAMAVEELNGVLSIVQTSPRGAPPQQRTEEKRKMRYFDVPRLANADTIYSHQLQNVREIPAGPGMQPQTVLMQLQTQVTRRLSGPTGLQQQMEYTRERHRLGAIQGVVKDADGSTLYDWSEEFGITAPTEVAFNLTANTEGTLRPLCAQVVRGMARASKGAFNTGTKVYALCSDEFWDSLVVHVDVVKTYQNWQAAAELRQGIAFEAMYFGGIYWFNYRGSDNLTDIGLASGKVRFFPVGAPGAIAC